MAAFPNAWFADAYGLTETVSGDTFLDASTHCPNSLGRRPVPHTRVRIVDEPARTFAAGEIGEIALRGPKVFAGYWRDEKATAAAIRAAGSTRRIGHGRGRLHSDIDDRKKT